GLADDQLRMAACPPSNLTLLGLVRHTTDVERAWFGRRVAGRSPEELPRLYATDGGPDRDFDGVDDADVRQDLAAYETAVGRARRDLDGQDLDRVCGSGDRAASVRWICLHMIEEYARHNGHADLLREAIDGRTGT
ncbi:MAG: DinB family protein, partial [Acidimicrobiales bacterium]